MFEAASKKQNIANAGVKLLLYWTDMVTGILSHFKVLVAMTQCLASGDMEAEAR